MRTPLLSIAMLAALAAGAQSVPVTRGITAAMNRIDTNTIRGHVAYLADDRLRGRLPGTEGYQMAVEYVSNQFRSMGIRPGGDAGAYTQRLVIRKSTLSNASAAAVLRDAQGNTDSLVFGRDFIPEAHPLRERAAAEGKLVFAGYGIDIPGGYSDYTGTDVRGKIVVIVSGAPDGLPSTLQAHFSNAGNKYNTAAARGAAGVIVINPAARNSAAPTAPVQSNVTMNPEKTAAFGRRFTGTVPAAANGTRALLNRLFFQSGRSLESLLAGLKAGKPASFDLPFSMSVSYNTTHQDIESYNVVGLISGSDAKLKNEYVVHSAHLDHLGVGRPVDGDSIYNGAHDNASGVASLLEIARLYKTSGTKPKRSVLIVFVTGEEMGLIGSSYFAANPTVPKANIVADVNTDMPTVIAPLLSVVPLGAEHSTLMEHVRFAAGRLGLDVETDPEPSENRFVRSDQYSFVMSGIPALHIKYGNKTSVPGTSLVDFVKQWRAKYYHKPQDGMDGIFNWTAAKTYVQLNFLISWSVANTAARPQWNAGDLFGTTAK
ncbi:MAG: M20/M25/M40 family metallo-hydrolase [Chitinophagaceae bacterium]|nr:MAG: M20/M25/M40 family metallo-hydrolase [Chitinophagaceae bacterium]